MKTAIAIGTFLISATSLFAQAKLEVSGGDAHDWGKVKPKDTPLKAFLVVKNVGTEVLKVDKVQPACGCTSAPISKSEIMPGDTASVQVSLNISNTPGAVHKSISFFTNDPQHNPLVYNLRADVVTSLQFSPSQFVSFPSLTRGLEGKANLSIKNNTSSVVKLSDFELPEGVKLNLGATASIAPNEVLDLEVSYTPKKTGYYNATVKMKTTDPDNTLVELPLYGNVEENPARQGTVTKDK